MLTIHDPSVQTGAALRVCVGCGVASPLEMFSITEAGQRRRICASCLSTVDARLDMGHSCNRISADTGIGYTTVTARRDERGIQGRRHGRVKDTRQLVELFIECRMTEQEIATELKVHPRTVRRHLEEAGVIEPHTPGTRMTREEFEARLARARTLFEDGCSRAEVSRTVGIGAQTLKDYFPEFQAPPDNRSMWAAITFNPQLRALHEEIEQIQVEV